MGNREAWAKCKAKIECPSVGDPAAEPPLLDSFGILSLCVFLFLLIDNASAVQKKLSRHRRKSLRGPARSSEMSPVCVLRESSCFLLLIHTRARGYLLTLKCLRVSFRDAVRHEAEGRAACSKMVSEKNIVECGGHSTTRSSSSSYGLRHNYKCYEYQQHKDEISVARRHTKQVYCSWHNIEALLWPVAVVPTRIRNNGCDNRNRCDLSLRTAKPSFPDGSYIHITKFVPITRGEMNLQKHLYTHSSSTS